MKHIILKSGFFRRTNSDNASKSELPLTSWLKNVLSYFKITIADPCCPTTLSPTRYNETTGDLEYFNQTTNTWDITTANSPNAWDLLGNAGTDSSVNFMGTTDDVDVMFRRDNIEAGHIQRVTTAIGFETGNYPLESNFTQAGNTYFGARAGKDSIGGENTFVGGDAGQNNNEFQVTGVGLSALANNTGFNATSVGFQAGLNNSGQNLSSLGVASGRSNSGEYVLALGAAAGENNTQDNRVIIGINELPKFANATAASLALPVSGVSGVYLYWDLSDNTIKARP